jgi:DoxX-like family
MRAKTIGYWATTIFVALELLAGGLTDLMHGPQALVFGPPVVTVITQLGYPVYVLTILGGWKLLGAVALLMPRFPRLKEWAYAGTFFEMTGAGISLWVIGADIGAVSFPFMVAALALASWALRPPDRTLGSLFPATRSRTGSRAGAAVHPARANVHNEVEA